MAKLHLDHQPVLVPRQRGAGRRCRTHRALLRRLRHQAGHRRRAGAEPSAAGARWDAAERPAALKDYQRERVASVGARQRIARYSAEWFEQVERCTALDPIRFSYALGTTRWTNSPAPAGVPWLLHQATQLTVGRRALGIVSAVRRRQRARQR